MSETNFNPGQCLAVIEICEKLGVEKQYIDNYRAAAAKMTVRILSRATKELEDAYRQDAFGIVTPKVVKS